MTDESPNPRRPNPTEPSRKATDLNTTAIALTKLLGDLERIATEVETTRASFDEGQFGERHAEIMAELTRLAEEVRAVQSRTQLEALQALIQAVRDVLRDVDKKVGEEQ